MNNPVFKVLNEVGSNEAILKLIKDDFEIIPEQRKNGNEIVFELPLENIQVGFYDIKLNDNKAGSIALNHDKRESLMDQYINEEVRSVFLGKVDILSNLAIDGVQNYFKTRFEGIALWRYCLILSLLFLLIEIVLLRFLK